MCPITCSAFLATDEPFKQAHIFSCDISSSDLQRFQENKMSVDSSIISQMRAITISREYGSGGGEIARRLAKRLGWGLIDHEAVIRVAQELGVSEAEAAVHDEYAEGLVSRIMSSMQAVDPAMYAAGPVSLTTNAQEYHKALEKV